MITITCDVCKKKLDDAQYGRTFFYYATRNLCEPCKDSFELQVKNTIRNKDPYAIDWYDKYVRDTLDKAVQKGKI